MRFKAAFIAGALIFGLPHAQPNAQTSAGARASSDANPQLPLPGMIQLAQVGRSTTAANEGEQSHIDRVNTWTVGVAGGLLEGTFIRFAADLAKALDDGDNLRILPVVTYGAAENISDLLYLKGVDVAITDADVFDEYRKQKKFSNIEKRIHYISEMYNSEFHVFARPEIKELKDLEGKKVGFNTKGSAAGITGKIVFERLKINVEPVYINNSIGIEKMKTGEFAAIVHTVGKPNDLFAKLKPEPGFHFVPVPYNSTFDDYYLPTTLTSADYPNLIKADERVETIAVPVVLAVYNWPQSSDRFRRVERFIQYYFSRFETMRKPPYHPKWQEINLAAKVAGWTRYWVAEQALNNLTHGAAAVNPQRPGVSQETLSILTKPEDQRLFDEFLAWKQKQRRQ
jgi:TRAP-type uncharacterized transport system substrate-binding protein